MTLSFEKLGPSDTPIVYRVIVKYSYKDEDPWVKEGEGFYSADIHVEKQIPGGPNLLPEAPHMWAGVAYSIERSVEGVPFAWFVGILPLAKDVFLVRAAVESPPPPERAQLWRVILKEGQQTTFDVSKEVASDWGGKTKFILTKIIPPHRNLTPKFHGAISLISG